MPAGAGLPTEILLTVFEAAADFDPRYINLELLHCAYRRNATLAACAIVCKAWRGPAQKVLFSDISLGAIAGPEDEFMNLQYPGRTESTLSSLISTLETFKKTSNSLRQNIRSMHMCVGHTDAEGHDPKLLLDYVVHGSPENVVRAITLCPGLIHLSLTIGAQPNDDESGSSVTFPKSALDQLAAEKPTNLRQLSINQVQDDTTFHPVYYDQPTCVPAYLTISILAPSLTIMALDIDFDEDEVAEAESFVTVESMAIFPALHTLHCMSCDSRTQSSICTRAPSLRTVVAATVHGDSDLRDLIPADIEDLTIAGLNLDDDISIFQNLKRLTLDYLITSLSTPDEMPLLLRRLPPSLEHLSLPVQMAVSASRFARHLVTATRKLPHLQALTFLRPPGVFFDVERAFHVPIKFKDAPEHYKFFRCSD